jgi:hypothetical protein
MAQLLDPEQWGRGPGTPDTPTAAGERPPGPRRTGAPAGAAAAAPSTGEWDPFADEPAAAPRQPRGGSTPPPAPPRSGSRLPVILIVVLVVLALIAGGIWAAASGLLPFGGPAGGGPTAAPETAAPPVETAEPEETGAPAEEPAGAPLPASCDELYSDSMRGTIEGTGLLLNPDWHVAGGETRLPSEDPELQEILGPIERLDCAWLEDSPSGVGIYTSVSRVTSEQAAAAGARMAELGYGAIEELGGVRYVTETSGDGNTLGESHFLRDGLWFGTLWINYGPAGYTADMVTQVFG